MSRRPRSQHGLPRAVLVLLAWCALGGASGSGDIATHLRRIHSDSEPDVMAANAELSRPAPRGVQTVRAVLDHPSPQIRAAAAEALARIGQAHVAPGTSHPSCLDGGCHQGVPRHPLLHRPVAKGSCSSCHPDVAESPVASGAASPQPEAGGPRHPGETVPPVSARRAEGLCLDCHQGLKNALADARSVHRPAGEGRCGSCHEPHGSEFGKLLTKPFPKQAVMKFEIGNFALCWICHDPNLALTRRGRTQTGFRNGDLNLHFTHVNADKGHNCASCHAPHGSPQEKLVPLPVRINPTGWSIPLYFRPTPTGGSCTSGCHRERDYDREVPVRY